MDTDTDTDTDTDMDTDTDTPAPEQVQRCTGRQTERHRQRDTDRRTHLAMQTLGVGRHPEGKFGEGHAPVRDMSSKKKKRGHMHDP